MLRFSFIFNLIVAIACVLLLFSGSSILQLTLDKNGNFPAGTLVAWLGFVAVALAIHNGFSLNTNGTNGKLAASGFLGLAIKINIVASVCWGFIGYLLATNWAFNFSGDSAGFRGSNAAATWFWNYSFILALLSLTLVIAVIVYRKLTIGH